MQCRKALGEEQKEKEKAKQLHKMRASTVARRATGQRTVGRSSQMKPKEKERTKAKGKSKGKSKKTVYEVSDRAATTNDHRNRIHHQCKPVVSNVGASSVLTIRDDAGFGPLSRSKAVDSEVSLENLYGQEQDWTKLPEVVSCEHRSSRPYGWTALASRTFVL